MFVVTDRLLMASRFQRFMNACLIGSNISYVPPELCDHRYFYKQIVDGNIIGTSLCGVARNIMARKLRQYGVLPADDINWFNSVVKYSDNSAMIRFIVQNACLSTISNNGLVFDTLNLPPMDTIMFSGAFPDFDLGKKIALYCPLNYNFVGFEGIILDYDAQRKCAHLYPLQVFLPAHRCNTEMLFPPDWDKWSRFLDVCDKITVTFLWITDDWGYSHGNSDLESNDITGNPEYYSRRIPISALNPDLAARLAIARMKVAQATNPSHLIS
jgi:hypothetical protein